MRPPQLSLSKTALGGTPKPRTHVPSTFQRLREAQFGPRFPQTALSGNSP